MSVHALALSQDVDAMTQAKNGLAAAPTGLAMLHDLEKGIDNEVRLGARLNGPSNELV